jgi:hypothetical protein
VQRGSEAEVDTMVDDRDARIAQLEAENAALRSEGERRNRDLAEAPEEQAATAEVLKVIRCTALAER